MKKAPKKYKCVDCGYISDRFKKLEFPTMTFATCFKCRGRVEEREEWLTWLYSERDRQREEAIKYNNGIILGVKIN